jgi:Holliday junction resolvase-like predicted endonuclease
LKALMRAGETMDVEEAGMKPHVSPVLVRVRVRADSQETFLELLESSRLERLRRAAAEWLERDGKR